MTMLDAMTTTVVGMRTGLELLALCTLIVWGASHRAALMMTRVRRVLLLLLALAIGIAQPIRLAWILGTPSPLVGRTADLLETTLMIAVVIGARAVFAVEQGVGVNRVRGGVIANVLVVVGMVGVAWAYL